MEKFILKNSIPAIIKTNQNTPRIALSLYLNINTPETKAGVYTLLNRLFMQGTQKRNSEELAQILEENAIELYSEMKHDFIRFKILCLNEDINLALEILADIINNSHFETFEKEKVKLEGEIIAELDSPRTKALDNYYKNLYSNHQYGNTYTKILENLESITKEDVISAYEDIIKTSTKNICIVGDIQKEHIESLLNQQLSSIKNEPETLDKKSAPQLTETKIATIEKEDANQAQIILGWIFPSIHSEDYCAISLMNTILGSSGLSSRLFLELREKQGLAYVVRSSYESYRHCASFSVYIATEPKNIKTCIEGFKKEIEKIQTIAIDEKELEDAKNNILGKRQFFTETNLLQAILCGFYETEGLGCNYEEKLTAAIKAVTSEKIMQVAQQYFAQPKVLSILAPKQYLSVLKDVIL